MVPYLSSFRKRQGNQVIRNQFLFSATPKLNEIFTKYIVNIYIYIIKIFFTLHGLFVY